MPRPADPALAPVSELRDAVGQVRPIITGVRPVVEGGHYPAKGSLGEAVVVEADIVIDGEDVLAAEVRFRSQRDRRWRSEPLQPLGNDRWKGEFNPTEIGAYRFCVRANVDEFGTWRNRLELRSRAGQNLAVELLFGSQLVSRAALRSKGSDRRELLEFAGGIEAAALVGEDSEESAGLERANAPELIALMARYLDGRTAVTSAVYPVEVERARARFSSWYELFPRSTSVDPFRPGTLADVEARLDYVARLGFDVLYLPPVHPIGKTARKGKNGSDEAGASDPGSPWAIGDATGGHTAVHLELGTLADFDRLVKTADAQGIDLALDLAFQCSPDHPWVNEHPDWFRRLPDGGIATAENPPKRYDDVYPLNFATDDWRNLWEALRGVVEFWIDHGVRVFRVDNPHTKPFRFWEWLLPTIRVEHPDVIMLSEAFTRPRIMEHLAKIGFSQSYTYFTWRNTAGELESYLTELTGGASADFLRPNLWPNTPDILHEVLQTGGRPAFAARLVLAATLAASYGIYGPAFELLVHEARAAGSEEYLNSEKFEVRHWDLEHPGSLADLITRVNAIRHGHPALQQNRTLRFHHVDNDRLLVYSKTASAGLESGGQSDIVLTAVNCDPWAIQAGSVHLDLDALGLDPQESFTVHDLLTGARYAWAGPENYIRLDPAVASAHIFHIERAESTAS